MKNWISQIVMSNKVRTGKRKPQLVFTEQGVAMLSSILNSEKLSRTNLVLNNAKKLGLNRVFERKNLHRETQRPSQGSGCTEFHRGFFLRSSDFGLPTFNGHK